MGQYPSPNPSFVSGTMGSSMAPRTSFGRTVRDGGLKISRNPEAARPNQTKTVSAYSGCHATIP